MSDRSFTPALFKFLSDLDEHNDREWFAANKERYEEHVKEAGLQFIADFGPRLRRISPHFVADARPVGGSLFRIYRDTRFSKDKTPYKTNTGMQFRHEAASDAHAPGFYLHLEPRNCFVGIGTWRPDTPTLRAIRDAIVDDPEGWKRAAHGVPFREQFELGGDQLKNPPRGYDVEHPMIDDLRRKDFIATAGLSQRAVTSPGFIDDFEAICKKGVPFMRFLCAAVGVAF